MPWPSGASTWSSASSKPTAGWKRRRWSTGWRCIPRKAIPYRGLAVEEMDLDAILARRPEVVIVDELPHTNVPGSRHEKRYQDVLEILDAGIHVIGALNIQHLESLKDIVERTSGVHIRETIPDTFLKQADQVVNLDLAIEDLVDRLRSGKIYATEKVTQALENFFQHQNLSTLRELALREVAESVDRTASAQHNLTGGDRTPSALGTRDGLDGVQLAAGQRPAAPRIAAGRPLEYRLVRRLRGNARRSRRI